MKAVLVLLVASVSAVSAVTLPSDDRTIAHVLNRMAFGPRAGDVERVRAMGLERYVDQQLHPERVPDPGMSERLAQLTTLSLSRSDIARQYEEPLVAARREKKQNDDAAPKAPNDIQRRANGVVVELAEQKI